jgi:hypothetical protein
MAAEVVVELAVAVVVAVVVEVEVAVAGGVPFGHPRPPKMSTIVSITLSDKVIVLKKSIIINPFRVILLCSTLIITMAYQYAGVYSGVLEYARTIYSGVLVRESFFSTRG